MGHLAKSNVSLSHEIQCVCVLTERKRVPLSFPQVAKGSSPLHTGSGQNHLGNKHLLNPGFNYLSSNIEEPRMVVQAAWAGLL